MSESIYAPPVAEVADTPTDEPPFYLVGTKKFYWLSLLTFNLYFVYWSYRNWRNIKRDTGESLWPVPRGIFFIFFTHSLFNNVSERLKTIGAQFAWRPGTDATLFVVFIILSNVLSRLSDRGIGSPMTDLASVAFVPLLPLLLLRGQRAINLACGDPDGSQNQGLTVVNWVWMVLGGLVWLLAIFGVYLILFEPELLVE